ncbi:hypothetical protein [Amycolatopsis sp. CA-126428]|uniref:hypothetical protein n=1 Tax=Amycolatopsis sp. CA-126428 TaxID=2073158 RepID=UPI0018EC26DD|nr:hypothetical protein [Amycolatopsis sp. CA-126428]
MAVSAHNIEPVKELPAEHRLVGDRAVGLQLVERRRVGEGADWGWGSAMTP